MYFFLIRLGHVKKQRLALLVRAVNYNVGLQKFTVVFLTSLEEIGSLCCCLRSEYDALQTGVCALTAGIFFYS